MFIVIRCKCGPMLMLVTLRLRFGRQLKGLLALNDSRLLVEKEFL